MAKVLVVDDSRFTRTMLRGMLYSFGHEVVGEAENVPQAIESYKSLKPEVVTLDLVLPGGSGIDVLKTIRQESADAKVIVVTASGQEQVDEQVLELGAFAVLHKPFTADEFKSIVQSALGLSRG
ncbi:MAG: response regulator [Elusimicrobia bacterium]|nr:response regulator [Elusimicrobiota bacterium]